MLRKIARNMARNVREGINKHKGKIVAGAALAASQVGAFATDYDGTEMSNTVATAFQSVIVAAAGAGVTLMVIRIVKKAWSRAA